MDFDFESLFLFLKSIFDVIMKIFGINLDADKDNEEVTGE